MSPTLYAELHRAIDKVVMDARSKATLDQEGWVYHDLSIDMAQAARLVWDACMKSSLFTEQQK